MIKIPKLPWRIIFLASLGGALELYDFVIFAFLAPVLGVLFFPSKDPTASVLRVFAVFAIGYLARPIGGIICGYFGDRRGRKKTFLATVIMMAIPTFLMGLLPTYANIGISAAILLCVLRIFQGFAMAGEVPGAIVFITESIPANRGMATGFILFGLNIGILLGSLFVTALNNGLTHEQLLNWGWRIPFFLGGTLGVVCYYLRKQIQETPLFQKLLNESARSKNPLTDVIRNHFWIVLQGMGLTCLGAVLVAFYFYMPTYFTLSLHYPKDIISTVNSVGILIFASSSLAMAILSDYVKRKMIVGLGCVGFLVFSIPIYHLFQGGVNYTHLLLGEFALSIMTGLVTGVFPCLLAEIFQTKIRYSGFASAYNLSYAIAGGLTPSLITLWIQQSGNLMAPSYYLMIAASITLLTILSINKFYLRDQI